MNNRRVERSSIGYWVLVRSLVELCHRRVRCDCCSRVVRSLEVQKLATIQSFSDQSIAVENGKLNFFVSSAFRMHRILAI
jgi:hypothetical protein